MSTTGARMIEKVNKEQKETPGEIGQYKSNLPNEEINFFHRTVEAIELGNEGLCQKVWVYLSNFAEELISDFGSVVYISSGILGEMS